MNSKVKMVINKHIRYVVVDPKGEVINKWLSSEDLSDLAIQEGLLKRKITSTEVTINLLESKGYLTIKYNLPHLKVNIPKEDVLDDWNYYMNK